jgi:hypothetical protein
MKGTLAQMVERRPEEPGVTGSNPVGTTNDLLAQLVRAPHF